VGGDPILADPVEASAFDRPTFEVRVACNEGVEFSRAEGAGFEAAVADVGEGKDSRYGQRNRRHEGEHCADVRTSLHEEHLPGTKSGRLEDRPDLARTNTTYLVVRHKLSGYVLRSRLAETRVSGPRISTTLALQQHIQVLHQVAVFGRAVSAAAACPLSIGVNR
jgi:hypothetical protein